MILPMARCLVGKFDQPRHLSDLGHLSVENSAAGLPAPTWLVLRTQLWLMAESGVAPNWRREWRVNPNGGGGVETIGLGRLAWAMK